jgi:hypothetical protein
MKQRQNRKVRVAISSKDSPKVIALLVAVLCVFAFIGTTVIRFNMEEGDAKPKRERNANLMLNFPSQSQSAGSMVLWQAAEKDAPNPFRKVFSDGTPRAMRAGQPDSEFRPLDPQTVMGVSAPPMCLLKGTLGDLGGTGGLAVFMVGEQLRMIPVGGRLIEGVFVAAIDAKGVVLNVRGKHVPVQVAGAFTPSTG